MAKNKQKRGEIWWLAEGYSSRSRQPSFASSMARPVVSTSFYRFGWHRKKACFVTAKNHDLLLPYSIEEYPCDADVARSLLRFCAYKHIADRFFKKPYASEADAELCAAAGHMVAISLRASHHGFGTSTMLAVASLHFYSPDHEVQQIILHNGMTRSFGRVMEGMNVADIEARMR